MRRFRLQRHHGGGGVIYWGVIVDSEYVGPFRVPDRMKMNAQGYIAFLEKNVVSAWFKKKGVAFNI